MTNIHGPGIQHPRMSYAHVNPQDSILSSPVLEKIQETSLGHLYSLHTHRDIEQTLHPFPFPTDHLPSSKLTHISTRGLCIISITAPYHLFRNSLHKPTQLSSPHTPRFPIP